MLICLGCGDSSGEDVSQKALNKGPDCRNVKTLLPNFAKPCELACLTLWSKEQHNYIACVDPMSCFFADFWMASNLSDALEGIDKQLAWKLSTGCLFGNSLECLIELSLRIQTAA